MKVEHLKKYSAIQCYTVLYSAIQCYTVCVGMNNSCPTMLATGILFFKRDCHSSQRYCQMDFCLHFVCCFYRFFFYVVMCRQFMFSFRSDSFSTLNQTVSLFVFLSKRTQE